MGYDIKKQVDIANSITSYIYKMRKRSADINPYDVLDIYNDWVHKTGTEITNTDMAIWAYQHMMSMCTVSQSTLNTVVKLDHLAVTR